MENVQNSVIKVYKGGPYLLSGEFNIGSFGEKKQ